MTRILPPTSRTGSLSLSLAVDDLQAELRPIEGGVDTEDSSGAVEGGGAGGASSEMYTQADEEEMGMTYAELGVFGYATEL